MEQRPPEGVRGLLEDRREMDRVDGSQGQLAGLLPRKREMCHCPPLMLAGEMERVGADRRIESQNLSSRSGYIFSATSVVGKDLT